MKKSELRRLIVEYKKIELKLKKRIKNYKKNWVKLNIDTIMKRVEC